MELSDKPVTAMDVHWSTDMSKAVLGRKLLALNPSGVAVFATLTSSTLKHYLAWCSLPKLTPEQKEIVYEAECNFSVGNTKRRTTSSEDGSGIEP